MGYHLSVAVILIVLLIAIGRRVGWKWKRGIPVLGDEEREGPRVFTAFRPHLCMKRQAWMLTAHTRAMKIGEAAPLEIAMVDPSGQAVLASLPVEKGVVICDGVFCGACGQRLACRCGRTPTRETVLEGRDAQMAVLACCARPSFGESTVGPSLAGLSVGRRFHGKDIPSS